MLTIHNTFTRQKTPFKPITPGIINMYVCGITVYDYCHIGHARTILAFDVIYRFLKSQGYQVNYVRNITDIDDKIIRRAQESGMEVPALTEKFIQAMHEDFEALGALAPTLEPRATDCMAQIITMITQLMDNGYAYQARNGDVYYRVKKFASYGALSNRNIDDLCAGARIDISEAKDDPLDFVLWKQAKPGEPHWPSPWGEGRPGWHIECSAMSTHFLANHFDIHGGGHDLTFPHHENERAQSEGATGETFVNTWIHTGFVEINDEKMSKSLDNFFTIREVLAEFDAEVVRLFLIACHYRSPLNYSRNNLKQTRASLARLYLALRGRAIDGDLTPDVADPFMQRFNQAMQDDFNTPVALAVLFDLAKEINTVREARPEDADRLAMTLKHLAGLLGLLERDPESFLQGTQSDKVIEQEEIEALIHARERARFAKDFAQADAIRKQLADRGVLLEDSAQGTTWRRG